MQHNDLCVILTYFHYVGKNLKFGASCSERERERESDRQRATRVPACMGELFACRMHPRFTHCKLDYNMGFGLSMFRRTLVPSHKTAVNAVTPMAIYSLSHLDGDWKTIIPFCDGICSGASYFGNAKYVMYKDFMRCFGFLLLQIG